MAIISATCEISGIPKDGVPARLWDYAAFVSQPAMDTAYPAGGYLIVGPLTTGPTYGAHGRIVFDVESPGKSYWLSFEYGGHIIWKEHSVSPRVATIVVAASNSHDKTSADYVCDGVDDQVEIQAAIDGLPIPGGTVQLLEGEFSINDTIVIDRDRVNLQGMGWGWWGDFVAAGNPGWGTEGVGITKLKATAGMPNPMVWGKAGIGGRPKGIRIGNLYLYGFNYTRMGILIDSFADQPVIHDVFVHHFEHGIGLGADCGHIEHCTVMDCSGDGIIAGDFSPRVHNCVVYDNGRDGIVIGGNIGSVCGNSVGRCRKGILIYAPYVSVIGNTSDWNRDDQIELNTTKNSVVMGNILHFGDETVGYGGIWVGGTPKPSGCIIMGNNIVHDGTGNTPDAAITVVSGCVGIKVKDNTVSMPNGGTFQVGVFDLQGNVLAFDQYSDLFMDILAESANQVVAAEDLTQAPPITCTLAGQPDVPRNIKIAITDGDASISAFQITVSGVDAKGQSVSEAFTQAGGLNQIGAVAFASIISVVVDSITGDNAGDVLNVGIGSKLGISNQIYLAADIYKLKKNNAHYPVASYTVNAAYDTVDVSTGGAIVGGDDFTIFYRSNQNVVV